MSQQPGPRSPGAVAANRYRWVYVLGLVLLAAAGGYLLFPQAVGGDVVKVWTGDRPRDFTVLDPRWTQEVHGSAMRINGLERTINAQTVGTLWRTLASLGIDRAKVVNSVTSDQLAAYGIDQQHGIDAGDWHLRWGAKDGFGYLWDGQRILEVGAGLVAQLARATARLDDPGLLPQMLSITDLTVDSQRFLRQGSFWQEVGKPPRPGLDRQVGVVLYLLGALHLDRLDPPPAAGAVLHRLQFPDGQGKVRELTLRGDGVGGGATATLDGVPPQAISAADRASWQVAVESLHRDYLLPFDGATARARIKAMAVRRGGAPWFSVERRQLAYRPGETSWELTWPNGQETASEAAVARTLALLCDVNVSHAEPGPDPSPLGPFALDFDLTDQGDAHTHLWVDGDRAWTVAFHGQMAPPSPVGLLQVADLLELQLIDAAPERICKLQRIAREPPLREVMVRSEDGSWSRSVGSGAVDPVAIGRLARALTESQALSVRLSTAEDRTGMRTPDLELDLRLSPRAAGAPRMEIADDRDTVPQDRGFAVYQDGSQWRAVDVEGGVSYQIEPELVELLRTPLQSDEIMPLVPSLVSRLLLQRQGLVLQLTREGELWWLSQLPASAPRVAADPAQVRRYLRLLAGLTASAREPAAPVLLPGEARLVVVAVMPSNPGEEQLTLCVREQGAEDAEASVTSSLASAAAPVGRLRLATEAARDVLAVGPERFAATPAVPPALHPHP